MNIRRVIAIANEKMGESIEIEKGVFKGSIYIKGKEAGTYFIDFTDSANIDSFAYYQEKLLANEYYKSKEELQWNIYLFLLRDKIDTGFKKFVEKDERYARKYVLHEKEFRQFFDVANSGSSMKNNVIDGWREELDRIENGVLKSDIDIGRVVEAVMRGNPQPIGAKALGVRKNDHVVTFRKKDLSKIKLVNGIQLSENFRKFPEGIRSFQFGKVNLFKGTNGVGKTSTLEAIELAICGRNLRNFDVQEKDGCLSIMFNDSGIWQDCNPSARELFKNRAREWYNTKSDHLNEMGISFNRFNYFNADAAYSFAKATSVEESRKALYNIVLGPEYELVSDKAHKMWDRIRPEYDRLSGERGAFEQQKGEYERKIEDWMPKEILQGLATEIDEDLMQIGLVDKMPSILEGHVLIERRISEVSQLVNKLIENDVHDAKSMAERKEEYINNSILITRFQGDFNKLNLELSDLSRKRELLKVELTLLERCIDFFDNPVLFRLDGAAKRIAELQRKIAGIEHISVLLRNISFEKYHPLTTLDGIINQTRDFIAARQAEKNKLNIRLSKEISRLSKIRRKINRIKHYGRGVMEAEPTRENCPLCDAAINRDQLLESLLQSAQIDSNGEDLEELQQVILDYDREIIQAEEEYHQLLNLQHAAKLYNLNESLSISRMISMFHLEISQLSEIQALLEDEKSLARLGKQYDVSETSYWELARKLNEKYPDHPFSLDTKEYYLDQILFTRKLIQANNNKYDFLKADISSARERLLYVIGIRAKVDEWNMFFRIDRALKDWEEKMKFIDEVLSRLSSIIDVDGIAFSDLQFKLNSICAKIDTYRKELKLELELEEARKVSAEMENKLKIGESKFLEYKDAYETLDKIKKNTADEHVKLFFNQHMIEVMDVFQSIHVPKEFKSISIEDGDVVLMDVNNVPRKVTQISTGQRSALAIAIFLTLNRSLKKGPDLIIFDDPVAFVDDLNALSFLDYLRFFVLREDKQIFFATANVKLANLFRRKFQFLGMDEGYKEWDFDRTGVAV